MLKKYRQEVHKAGCSRVKKRKKGLKWVASSSILSKPVAKGIKMLLMFLKLCLEFPDHLYLLLVNQILSDFVVLRWPVSLFDPER